MHKLNQFVDGKYVKLECHVGTYLKCLYLLISAHPATLHVRGYEG